MNHALELQPGVAGVAFTSSVFIGIAITFFCYVLAMKIYAGVGAPVFLNPLLICIVMLATGIHLAKVPYALYFQSAEAIHLLLNPVIVLLAVPLWRQLRSIRQLGARLAPVLLVGALTGIATSAGVAYLLGLSAELVSTLAPKSVTAAVAIQLSESLGGIPTITAVIVILTGLAGATFGFPLLKACGVRDRRAQGFAIGLASHAIGTARAFQVDQVAGAYSSLGMILNAIITAVLVGLMLVATG